jgi:hypothetical protein
VLLHGKASNDLEKFGRTVEDLTKEISKQGLTLQEVNDYLYARHAIERNTFIRDNVDPENQSGSGISDERATEILEGFDAEKTAKLEAVAKQVYDIIEDTRKTYEKFGLESKQGVEGLRAQYENYVPLRGFADTDTMGAEMTMTAGGSRLSVAGRENRRAAGRTTVAGDILSNVVAQHADAIIRGRKNEMLQTLYNFAKENPNTDIWKIYSESKPDTTKINVNGSIRNQPVNMRGNDQYVGVKIDGNQFYIKFMNPELGKTLNGASIAKAGLIIKAVSKLNRFLSAAMTSFNPEFVISNFARDIQTAMYNILSEQDISENSVRGKKLIGDALRNVPKAMAAIARNERGKEVKDQRVNQYYEEFKEDGAKTGWFMVKTRHR